MMKMLIYLHENKGAIMRVKPNTKRSPNVGIMLVQRRRRWTNIVLTLGERLGFAGKMHLMIMCTEFLQDVSET